MFLFVSILIGSFISLMIVANGQLGVHIGSTWALIIIHFVGMTASLAINPIVGNRKDSVRIKPHPITFLAGALGLVIVYLNTRVYLAGGVVLTLSGMLAGQSIAAAISDFIKIGKKDNTRSWKHLSALFLVVCGAIGIGLSSGVSFLWILLSWVPGGILMLQILMNSSVAGYYGQTRMLQISYTIGLVVIIIFAGITGGLTGFTLSPFSEVPILVLLGGGLLGVTCMTGQNMLLRKMSALKMVLGTYMGQFAMGVMMDMINGKGFDLVYIIGLGLIISGLVLQNLWHK
jgi:bacterial/archaeal transporter family-2 protein